MSLTAPSLWSLFKWTASGTVPIQQALLEMCTDNPWGIPGFRMVLCCFTHSLVWPGGLGVFCLICCFAIPYWDDTRLSPLASINPFHPWTGTCHVTDLLVLVVFWFAWFCVFVFCLFLVFWFCFGFVSFCALVMTLWQYTGLRIGPSPVHFWGHSTADGLRMP